MYAPLNTVCWTDWLPTEIHYFYHKTSWEPSHELLPPLLEVREEPVPERGWPAPVALLHQKELGAEQGGHPECSARGLRNHPRLEIDQATW